jgi:hypothetical protein
MLTPPEMSSFNISLIVLLCLLAGRLLVGHQPARIYSQAVRAGLERIRQE